MTRVKLIGVVLGLALFILFLVLPPFEPLTRLGMQTLAVFLLVLVWWITEPIPIGATSFLCLGLWVAVGVLPAKQSFGYLGDWINLLVIGACGIGAGLSVTGAAKRYSLHMLNFRFVRGRPWLLFLMFFISAGLLSAFASNTVSTIIFLTIGIPLMETAGLKKGDKFAAFFIMSIAWATNVGGLITPVGTPVNLTFMRIAEPITGYTFGFGTWVVPGFICFAIAAVVTLVVIGFVMKPDISQLKALRPEFISDELKKMGPMTLGEKLVWGYLAVVIVLWVCPEIIKHTAPSLWEAMGDRLNWAVPALVAPALMCLTPVNWKEKKTLMTFRDWAAHTEWGSIALIAACLSLGGVFSNPETGIIELFRSGVSPLVTGASPYLLVLIGVFFVTLMTNFMSNIASVTIMTLVCVPVSVTLGLGNPIAMGFAINAGAAMAFAFPSATTTTAIVYGTGWMTIPQMLKAGLLTALISAIVTAFVAYTVACWFFPWPI